MGEGKMKTGIYIVANDRVCNQLIALLNSAKINWPNHPPICVIPYDGYYSDVRAVVEKYSNVFLFEDIKTLFDVDKFFGNIWMSCEPALKVWREKNKHLPHRLGEHRRFLAFTDKAPFDRFLYIDVDTYFNRDLTELFELLNSFDLIAHDYQFKAPKHALNVNSKKLSTLLNGELEDQVMCSGFFLSRKDLFSKEQWQKLPLLIRKDADLLHYWAPDQTLLNYMINKFKVKFVNLIRYWHEERRTADSQTYTKFKFRDGKLYQNGKEITYFHHIGVPAEEFNRICEGKSPIHDFRYQDVFKYFRHILGEEL